MNVRQLSDRLIGRLLSALLAMTVSSAGVRDVNFLCFCFEIGLIGHYNQADIKCRAAKCRLAWHHRSAGPFAITASLNRHLKRALLSAVRSQVVAHFSPCSVFNDG